MRAPQRLVLACLVQFACDVKKLGVEGATCQASSDCADDLQCMQSVCVRPQASGVVARPALPLAPPVQVPPAAPPAATATGVVASPALPPAPSAPVPAAAPPAATATPPAATPPAPTLPPQEPPRPAPAETTPPPSGIPWLNRGADAAPPAPAPSPSTPADPAFLFTDPGSWTALVESGEPWTVSVLKAIQGIRIGVYAGGSPPMMTYKFRLSVCPDGRLKSYRKQGTGDGQVDGVLDNAIEGLKVAAPPPAIRAQLAGACKKIAHDFTMKFGRGKTEVK